MRILRLFEDFGESVQNFVLGNGDYGSTNFYVLMICLIVATALLIASIISSFPLVIRAISGLLGVFATVFILILMIHNGYIFG